MIEGMENQCLGTNAKAQEILKAQIGEFFPALDAAAEVFDEIINKYYDWVFPYIWTDDGGQERRWASAVRSLCRRHAKLAELEEYFASNATDATQEEKYGGSDKIARTGDDTAKNSGTDNVTFTDNRKQTTTVTFRGVGAPTSSANTAETTETELGAGANDTDTQTTHGKTTTTTHDTQDTTTYGKTRTWTDGRTWTQVLADVWAATSPVYDFVNAFAQILLSPDTVCVIWEPTMSMTADAEKLAPGSQPTASIVNVGTATHPRWELHLGLVTGDTGATPDITVTATVDDNVGTPEVTVTQTGTPEHPDIDFAFKNMKGETGETGATPDITMTASVDGTTGTPAVKVTEGGTPEDPTFNLAFSGLKGETGERGEKGERGYSILRSEAYLPPDTESIEWDTISPVTAKNIYKSDIILSKNGNIFVVRANTTRPDPIPVRFNQSINGAPGQDGVTPDITITATVDDTTGTPSVQVTEGGTPEDPTFNLAFSGLKGESAAGGAKVYRHLVQISLSGGSGTVSGNAGVAFECFSADEAPYTKDNICERLSGMAFVAHGGVTRSASPSNADLVKAVSIRFAWDPNETVQSDRGFVYIAFPNSDFEIQETSWSYVQIVSRIFNDFVQEMP